MDGYILSPRDDGYLQYPVADTDNETSIVVDLLQRERFWLKDIDADLCFDLHVVEEQR